jgi:hypothetical protein
MRIVSPYEPPIPVIDEETQKQILEAKLLAFRILQDRIAIAEELEESGVLDAWTEAIVSLERNADSVSFARNSGRFARRSPAWRIDLLRADIAFANCISVSGTSGRFENTNKGVISRKWRLWSLTWAQQCLASSL